METLMNRTNDEEWLQVQGRKAEEMLRSIDPKKLGPAGRLLVENPRTEQHSKHTEPGIRGVEGEGSEPSSQQPLLGGVPDE